MSRIWNIATSIWKASVVVSSTHFILSDEKIDFFSLKIKRQAMRYKRDKRM